MDNCGGHLLFQRNRLATPDLDNALVNDKLCVRSKGLIIVFYNLAQHFQRQIGESRFQLGHLERAKGQGKFLSDNAQSADGLRVPGVQTANLDWRHQPEQFLVLVLSAEILKSTKTVLGQILEKRALEI